MKVLSVRQPWAWAIIHGGKDIENRNWKTNYRGPLAIHAGQSFDFTAEELRNVLRGEYGNGLREMIHKFQQDDDIRGAIIGTVNLIDCIPSYACKSPWKAGDDPDYFCWKLASPRPLREPIKVAGKLGIFEVPGVITPSHLYCKGCFSDTSTSTTCGVCGNTKELIR